MPKKTKSRFEKIQSKAKIYYEEWRKKGSYSPALKEHINITRFGWNHLIDPRKRRSKVQKIKRFQALPLAKNIIETSTTFQEHRVDDAIHYYAFIAEISGKRIKVVVSNKTGKPKIFLSVIVLR